MAAFQTPARCHRGRKPRYTWELALLGLGKAGDRQLELVPGRGRYRSGDTVAGIQNARRTRSIERVTLRPVGRAQSGAVLLEENLPQPGHHTMHTAARRKHCQVQFSKHADARRRALGYIWRSAGRQGAHSLRRNEALRGAVVRGAREQRQHECDLAYFRRHLRAPSPTPPLPCAAGVCAPLDSFSPRFVGPGSCVAGRCRRAHVAP
jgi:hypothetical protein